MWGADYLSRLVSVKCQLKKGDTRATGPVFGQQTADFHVSGNRPIDHLATQWLQLDLGGWVARGLSFSDGDDRIPTDLASQRSRFGVDAREPQSLAARGRRASTLS